MSIASLAYVVVKVLRNEKIRKIPLLKLSLQHFYCSVMIAVTFAYAKSLCR